MPEPASMDDHGDRIPAVRDTDRKAAQAVDGADTKDNSLPASTKGNPNATPAAGTSGANSPQR